MSFRTRLVLWLGLPALLFGVVLGIAVGRSRTPFNNDPMNDSPVAAASTSQPAAKISIPELRALQESGAPFFLMDVREASEYADAHLAGSQSIPLGSIWTREADVPRDRPIVVYCANDVRGDIAMRELEKLGFSNVRHLEGGMSAWLAAGLRTVQ